MPGGGFVVGDDSVQLLLLFGSGELIVADTFVITTEGVVPGTPPKKKSWRLQEGAESALPQLAVVCDQLMCGYAMYEAFAVEVAPSASVIVTAKVHGTKAELF